MKQLIHLYTVASGRTDEISLLAVTKNQPSANILPLLDEGHRLFGENRVQEAYSKWPLLKQNYPDSKLHLLGHLQTNKVSDAVSLFDVIQTLDSFKLAEKLVKEETQQNKSLEYFIEVNIGQERQKSGILPNDIDDFTKKMRDYFPLRILGIMCIPPYGENPTRFFCEMKAIADDLDFSAISMGMSDDFKIAIENGATLLRIGRALF